LYIDDNRYELPYPIDDSIEYEERRAGGRPGRCAGQRDSHQCHRRRAEGIPRQAEEHGTITQVRLDTLLPQNPQGNNALRQWAAGQVPLKRMADPNEPPGRRCIPCLAGRCAMEAVNGDVR
jgi:hypothetical protein